MWSAKVPVFPSPPNLPASGSAPPCERAERHTCPVDRGTQNLSRALSPQARRSLEYPRFYEHDLGESRFDPRRCGFVESKSFARRRPGGFRINSHKSAVLVPQTQALKQVLRGETRIGSTDGIREPLAQVTYRGEFVISTDESSLPRQSSGLSAEGSRTCYYLLPCRSRPPELLPPYSFLHQTQTVCCWLDPHRRARALRDDRNRNEIM